MGLKELLLGILLSILAADFSAWFPRLTDMVLKFACRFLPEEYRDRFYEEWSADCRTIPGQFSRFIYAFHFVWAGLCMRQNLSFGVIWKRIFDIIDASFTLAFIMPLFVLISILLKLEGQKGKIFACEKRIGYKGKRFNLWIFNTEGVYPSAKTASFIRKTCLDELPMLWNVIRGDMSIVGPYPIQEKDIEHYGENFQYYCQVRPGIIGPWQIFRKLTIQEKVNIDTEYAHKRSFLGDIKIILKGLLIAFRR